MFASTRPWKGALPSLTLFTLLALSALLAALPAAADDAAKKPFPEPQTVEVEDDKAIQINVEFGISNVLFQGDAKETSIWTRSYQYAGKLCTASAAQEDCSPGLIPPKVREPQDDLDEHVEEYEVEIPGPTLEFHPGDLLQVTLNNLLSDESHESMLHTYESNIDRTFDTDEVAHHVRHEVNLPHDPNNTNLHVHGLHVDPSKDDVTLIVIPEGESKMDYDATLWPYIREQVWPYIYRIPSDHLPGTHWYHAHKHGSTSIHVENGMAGALLIQPNDPAEDIVPGLDPEHDRVMMLQEIANYGIQQGAAGGNDVEIDFDVDSAAVAKPGIGGTTPAEGKRNRPIVTVNGEPTPTLELAPEQVERWRFVNAAANHHSLGYLWLCKVAKKTDGTYDVVDSSGRKVTQDGKQQKGSYTEYQCKNGNAYLVAIDGITLAEKVRITAQDPIFVGPGNRADVLVQLDESADGYVMFKNYYPETVDETRTGHQIVVTYLEDDGSPADPPSGYLDKIANPYLLPQIFDQETNAGNARPNFELLERPWLTLDGDPTSPDLGKPKSVTPNTAIAPNLWLAPDESGDFAEIRWATDIDNDPHGWQPIAGPDVGGGVVNPQEIFFVEVKGEKVTDGPSLPSDEHLASISPTGDMKHRPPYVNPFDDSDILQSRTALFDLSGIDVLSRDLETGEALQQIRQFTLNGRQFDLVDSIGNTDATALITEEPTLDAHGSDVSLHLVKTEAHGLWNNDCWTNPGFYQKIVQSTDPVPGDDDPGTYYKYDDASKPCTTEGSKLTYQQVTGLENVAVVNAGYPGAGDLRGIPGLPVATSGEEWFLINNSPVSHPFHIHINPFLVEEVGQVSYEPFEGSSFCRNEAKCRKDATAKECQPPSDTSKGDGDWGWVVRTINPAKGGKAESSCDHAAPAAGEHKKLTGTSTLWWVVNNWWDTIVIPPHGYVKMRYWMNVPQQSGDNSEIEENVNRFGDWVYHCHILRHEDRGMMMVVGTQPKREKAME